MASIDPWAACYNNAISFNNKISKAVKELNDRDWEFKLKQDQDNVNNRKAYLEAIRNLGETHRKAKP